MNPLVEEKIAQSIVTESIEEVTRGAAWLDENIPNWYRLINLDTFDISESQFCIVGQLNICTEMVEEYQRGFPPQLGFDTLEDEDGPSYRELQEAWVNEIEARCHQH